MNRHSIQRKWLMTAVVAIAVSGMSGTSAWAQDADADDKALSSGGGIPTGVGELPGTAIASGNESNFVTIDRPEDMNRMFLLYNVGTGKFLNVGGYWGTHAALSTVPRPFWLQHRSETRVQGAQSYMRYPESKGEYAGVFIYEFYAHNTMQVGNCEHPGDMARTHVTYNYVRVVNASTGDFVRDLVPEGLTGDGQGDGNGYTTSDDPSKTPSQFQKTFDIDFSKERIEAQIDMRNCQGTAKGGSTMETMLSFGADVSKWDKQVCDVHIYGYKAMSPVKDADGNDVKDEDGNVKTELKYRVLVQPVDRDYFGGTTYDVGGDHRFIEVGEDGLVNITISSGVLTVNDKDCLPLNTYADSENHIPVISYVESLAGKIVKFKAENGKPVLENGKYVIDQENGVGMKVDNTFLYSGDDLSDDQKNVPLPFFLTSRFVKSTSSSRNEGSYMTWCPYDDQSTKYGTVGVFGDRALPYSTSVDVQTVLDYSRWFFEPVQGEEGNLYRMYIEADDLVTVDDVNNTTNKHEGRKKFYLQATDNYVYGNDKEGYTDNPVIQDRTNVEALEGLPTGDQAAEAQWKVISMADYYTLFKNPSSEFTSMLDLSFRISDPDFIAENGKLADWQMDEGLQKHVRIGYDQFSKKTVTDTDYTDDEGHRDISHTENGTTVWDQKGNDLHQKVKKVKINHGRYMGVDVKGEGTGRFYQDVKVDKAGWYAISCGGMSNAGATLFIQMKDKSDNLSVPTEQPLHVLTPEEKDWYVSPSDKGWPYDKIDDKNGMPMYNALVAINDENATNGYQSEGKAVTDRYNTQVSFFVDPNVLASNGGTLTLRFGVRVPAVATQAEDDSESSTTPVATNDRWTVFDNFHLAFGGYSLEPNLILDEERTDLDYIDRANHVFEQRPMRLKRTFTPDVWNTLILPVSLTKSNFRDLFGEKAQLAQLDHLTATTVEFVSVTKENERGELLEAFKPYIIKVQSNDKQSIVTEDYTVRLANREDGGKTLYDVSITGPYFYLESADLKDKKMNDANQPYYDFKSDGYLCKDNVLAKDESGTNTPLRAYGTLCKNYEGKSIIEGRPDLSGAYVMAGGNMRKLKGQYGTKGFRCWFVPESDDAQQTDINGVKVVIDGSDTGTGIADLVEADGGIYLGGYADGVYTLGGQLVRHGNSLDGLPAGIYIVNGLKYVVR